MSREYYKTICDGRRKEWEEKNGLTNKYYKDEARVFPEKQRYDYASLDSHLVIDAMSIDLAQKIIPKLLLAQELKGTKYSNVTFRFAFVPNEDPNNFDLSQSAKKPKLSSDKQFLGQIHYFNTQPIEDHPYFDSKIIKHVGVRKLPDGTALHASPFIVKLTVSVNQGAYFDFDKVLDEHKELVGKAFTKRIADFEKSAEKFLKGFEGTLDQLFKEDDCERIFEQLQKRYYVVENNKVNRPDLSSATIKRDILPDIYATNQDKCEIDIIDGFWGEGKTSLLSNFPGEDNKEVHVYTTELDTVFRAKLKNYTHTIDEKDCKHYYANHLFQSDYKLFVVIGLLYALSAASTRPRSNKDKQLVFDRFFSHQIFEALAPKSSAKPFTIDNEIMSAFVFLLKFYSGALNYTQPIKIRVNTFQKVQIPWPIKKEREMEIYEYQEDGLESLITSFERFYSFFNIYLNKLNNDSTTCLYALPSSPDIQKFLNSFPDIDVAEKKRFLKETLLMW